ncbi:MAG: ATP-binding cassette domain-containing protein [Opitutaceae bacterium]|jgi:iron complex transport system ATP-binding protein|nr:ATP-binding cassette domain-containing protein [Opitutaceae bacterium]
MQIARPPLLQIDGLHVRRGPVTLLADLAWRIESGQHWVVLGPNGCGKTSLLKVLLGYLSPSAGEVSVLGRRYGDCDWRELRFHVGIVSSALQASVPADEPALWTVVSGARAQLELWGEPTAAEARAARTQLRRAGAGDLAERPWCVLSQGERQRVLIARALMSRPRLLVLDEPCAGLDPVARETFLARVDALAREPRGPGLVLVTHHVEEITPSFTHALLLRAGRVVAAGPRSGTLTSRRLGDTFGAPLRLGRRDGRLELRVRREKPSLPSP